MELPGHTKFFIILFERAFKMMKNGVCYIVTALLVAEPFKTLIYANQISVTSQKGHKVVQNHKKLNISFDFLCIELKLSTVVTLLTKFHDMSTVTFPWQHNGLQALSIQKGKSEFSSFKKSYLLLLFIQ